MFGKKKTEAVQRTQLEGLAEQLKASRGTADPASGVLESILEAVQQGTIQGQVISIDARGMQSGALAGLFGAAGGPGAGWSPPDKCPDCGAPVDVNTVEVATNHRCSFCQQPLPSRS